MGLCKILEVVEVSIKLMDRYYTPEGCHTFTKVSESSIGGRSGLRRRLQCDQSYNEQDITQAIVTCTRDAPSVEQRTPKPGRGFRSDRRSLTPVIGSVRQVPRTITRFIHSLADTRKTRKARAQLSVCPSDEVGSKFLGQHSFAPTSITSVASHRVAPSFTK